MKISAEVVAASVSPAGYKIITLKVCGPDIIKPELLTHREMSRSFVSNRALPPAEARRMTGFVPLHWGKAQKGMQSREEELSDKPRVHDFGFRPTSPVEDAKSLWNQAALQAEYASEKLEELGLHKQTCNRVLQPFQWCTGVITATCQAPGEWPMANFLGLRAKSAKVEPHMHELAWCVADAINGAMWERVDAGQWHLPFIKLERRIIDADDAKRLAMASAMRCARASYNKLEGGTATIEEDAERARTHLMAPGDLHGSPFEHQAMCPNDFAANPAYSHGPHGRSGNFAGWIQFRKTLAGERSTFTDDDFKRGRVRVLRGQ